MLSFAEELLLLLLDDTSGHLAPISRASLTCGLAGAVLMDLELHGRIAADGTHFAVVDPTPTGEALLDPILAQLTAEPAAHDASYWVRKLAEQGDALHDATLDSLITRGILKEVCERFLWVLETRRYPILDDREQKEAKLRLLSVLLCDKQPDARDTVLINLADACGIFRLILQERELAPAGARIAAVAALDPIGRATAAVIREVETETQAAAAMLRGSA
jgi:golgi phosphoprotein 3